MLSSLKERGLTGSIYNINGVLILGIPSNVRCLPIAKRGRTLNGDTLLSFEVHTVHLRPNRVLSTNLNKANVIPLSDTYE